MPKFRIVYHVVEELEHVATEEQALAHMDCISDDLDEYSAQACGDKVAAVLQRWVPMPSPTFPKNGKWETVKTIGTKI